MQYHLYGSRNDSQTGTYTYCIVLLHTPNILYFVTAHTSFQQQITPSLRPQQIPLAMRRGYPEALLPCCGLPLNLNIGHDKNIGTGMGHQYQSWDITCMPTVRGRARSGPTQQVTQHPTGQPPPPRGNTCTHQHHNMAGGGLPPPSSAPPGRTNHTTHPYLGCHLL